MFNLKELKSIRIERGVNISKLAKDVGLSRHTIYTIESGGGRVSMTSVRKVLDYFGFEFQLIRKISNK